MTHLLINHGRLIYCNSQGKSGKSSAFHYTVLSHDKEQCKMNISEGNGLSKYIVIYHGNENAPFLQRVIVEKSIISSRIDG